MIRHMILFVPQSSIHEVEISIVSKGYFQISTISLLKILDTRRNSNKHGKGLSPCIETWELYVISSLEDSIRHHVRHTWIQRGKSMCDESLNVHGLTHSLMCWCVATNSKRRYWQNVPTVVSTVIPKIACQIRAT